MNTALFPRCRHDPGGGTPVPCPSAAEHRAGLDARVTARGTRPAVCQVFRTRQSVGKRQRRLARRVRLARACSRTAQRPAGPGSGISVQGGLSADATRAALDEERKRRPGARRVLQPHESGTPFGARHEDPALAPSRELDTPAGDPVRAKWSRRGRPRMEPIWKLVDHPSTIELSGRGEIPLYGPVAQLVRAADS